MKELFAQSLSNELADSDRLASAVPGQVGAKNILFSKFWAQLKAIFGVNNWSAREYKSSPCIVVYNKLQYILDESVAPLPYTSTDFPTELAANIWLPLGGSGGGGGHTIKDSTTTLTQRAGLKFIGNVAVTDDSGGDNTVVNIPNQTANNTSVTPPIGYTSTEMQGLSNEFGADIVALEASTIPPVVSGEKVVTRTPTSVNVDKDIIEMQIAAGTIASANWTTGQATYTGTQGQTTYDSVYKYECIGTNLWIRTMLVEGRLELYLSPDIDDSGGAKTSAQLDAAYPSAQIGQKVWGTTLYVYEKKATNLWRKISFTTA